MDATNNGTRVVQEHYFYDYKLKTNGSINKAFKRRILLYQIMKPNCLKDHVTN